MAFIELQLVEPDHNTAFVGEPTVTFRGAANLANEPRTIPLYYRWYSSLASGTEDDIKAGRFAMNAIDGVNLTNPATEYSRPLGMGTHVICFAATDRPSESATDLEAVEHGGFTGGSEGEAQCLIHVFKANLVSPQNAGTLNRLNCVLEAEAPVLWGKEIGDTKTYEPNQDYHQINRLQYRWQFTPVGAPFDRDTVNFEPPLTQLAFVPDPDPDSETEPPIIRYQGALPQELAGNYQLTLHVEDKKGQFTGDQVTIDITVTDGS
ncbi:hypothetical protein KFU94_56680 [Chloroflexi bacterium TSY]|nr:hypothetical protein [Chloroflexi bacterium TSY]